MKFQEVENPYTEEMKKKNCWKASETQKSLLMKEYEPWKKLLSGN